jgi:hypothetical protein
MPKENTRSKNKKETEPGSRWRRRKGEKSS